VRHGDADGLRDLLGIRGKGDEVGDAERKLLGDDRRHARAVDRCLLALTRVAGDAAGSERGGQVRLEGGVVGGRRGDGRRGIEDVGGGRAGHLGFLSCVIVFSHVGCRLLAPWRPG
jgi:hypothetical protein